MAALVLALAVQGAAFATVFNCAAGDVPCLIAAINTANQNPDPDTINLAAGTYTLTSVDNENDGQNGLPSITSILAIGGAGADTTVIERDPSIPFAQEPFFRILHVDGTGNLTLESLTIRNGFLSGPGAGIFNRGAAIIVDSIITNNVNWFGGLGGGGIHNEGTVSLQRSQVKNNASIDGNGGGIDGGTLTMDHSSVTGNIADVVGGGILVGSATIRDSTIAGNNGGRIGGIGGGSITIENSTIAGNLSEVGPAGISVGFGIIENCTIAGNRTTDGDPGGGIRVESGGVALINNSTIADNDALLGGGGIYNPDGTVQLQNTILARNTRLRGEPGEGEPADCLGQVTSLGHNLVGDLSGCTITLLGSDLTGDPGLDTFADDGSPANGHFPLLATSQAIDAGDPASCTPTDQLGHSRIDGDGDGIVICDIGAIEFSPAAVSVNDLVSLAPVVTAFDPTPVSGGPAGTFTITATLTNTSSTPIHDPVFRVTQLSGGNLLLNADGGPGGAGALLTPDAGADAILSPGESLTTAFVIGLQERRPFTFFVDLLGVPEP